MYCTFEMNLTTEEILFYNFQFILNSASQPSQRKVDTYVKNLCQVFLIEYNLGLALVLLSCILKTTVSQLGHFHKNPA